MTENIPKKVINIASTMKNANTLSNKNLSPEIKMDTLNSKNDNKNKSSSTNSSSYLPNITGFASYINYWDAETSKKIQNSTMSV